MDEHLNPLQMNEYAHAPHEASSNLKAAGSHQLTRDTMQHQGTSLQDHQKDSNWSYEASMKNWRAWGSWFSWGSPVGLGLFFISIAVTLWILGQAFGWS
jgi:hypothetical protein